MGRAIVREPQAFLFDEPLSNLDAKLRVQMRVEIRRLHNRLKATSIFVTHDQVEAMTLADMVVVMNGGRIEQIGAPTEVYRLPGDALRRDLHRLAGHEPACPARSPAPASSRRPAGASASPRMPSRPPRAARSRSASGPRTCASPPPGTSALAFAGDFVEELGATRLFHGTSGDAPLVVAVAAAEAETAGTSVTADRFRRAPVRSRQRQQLAQVGVRPHAAAMKTTERASHGV